LHPQEVGLDKVHHGIICIGRDRVHVLGGGAREVRWYKVHDQLKDTHSV
jgi:hypothetical protein